MLLFKFTSDCLNRFGRKARSQLSGQRLLFPYRCEISQVSSTLDLPAAFTGRFHLVAHLPLTADSVSTHFHMEFVAESSSPKSRAVSMSARHAALLHRNAEVILCCHRFFHSSTYSLNTSLPDTHSDGNFL